MIGASAPSSVHDPTAAQVRSLRERRRRVWRSVALIVLATLVMVLIAVSNRDEVAIRECRSHMEAVRAAFQEAYDKGLPMPGLVPPLMDNGPRNTQWLELMRFGHVRYNVLHERGSALSRRVGLGCCRWTHTRLFGASGRWVLTFNAQRRQYELNWMDENEFDQRADDLGLDDPSER